MKRNVSGLHGESGLVGSFHHVTFYASTSHETIGKLICIEHPSECEGLGLEPSKDIMSMSHFSLLTVQLWARKGQSTECSSAAVSQWPNEGEINDNRILFQLQSPPTRHHLSSSSEPEVSFKSWDNFPLCFGWEISSRVLDSCFRNIMGLP